MTIIATSGNYRVEFNGSKTYMVIDSAEQCRLATTSKVKAINTMNKIVKYAGGR
jgi:hypothetical protein